MPLAIVPPSSQARPPPLLWGLPSAASSGSVRSWSSSPSVCSRGPVSPSPLFRSWSPACHPLSAAPLFPGQPTGNGVQGRRVHGFILFLPLIPPSTSHLYHVVSLGVFFFTFWGSHGHHQDLIAFLEPADLG